MVLIPQRLFDNPQVKTILRDGNVCILTKDLTAPILKREGYISNHVVSICLDGLQKIETFMENNFDKPLKIEDYAYLTGRSLSTFRRDFKAYYQLTPQKWLVEKRLDKALTILTQKEISVTELAYEVGYENISYFIKAFKNKVGQSPKQYILAQHRNNLMN